jgi:hypothetical protein
MGNQHKQHTTIHFKGLPPHPPPPPHLSPQALALRPQIQQVKGGSIPIQEAGNSKGLPQFARLRTGAHLYHDDFVDEFGIQFAMYWLPMEPRLVQFTGTAPLGANL